MSDTASTIAKTVGSTLAELAPVLLAAAAGPAVGGAKSILLASQLASILINTAQSYHAAGQMTTDELAILYKTIGQSLQNTSDEIDKL